MWFSQIIYLYKGLALFILLYPVILVSQSITEFDNKKDSLLNNNPEILNDSLVDIVHYNNLNNSNSKYISNPKNIEDFLKNSLSYMRKGNNREALNNLNAALQINPNTYQALFYKGIMGAQSNNNVYAFANFEKCTKIAPGYIDAYILAAYVSIKENNFERAERKLNIALIIDTNNTDALHLLSYIFYKRGDYDKAFNTLEKIYENKPDYKFIYFNLAFMSLKLGQYNDAITLLNKSINKNELVEQSIYLRAYCKSMLSWHKQAIDDYMTLTESDYFAELAYKNIALSYLNIGLDYGNDILFKSISNAAGSQLKYILKSIEYFRSSLEINPDNSNTYLSKSFALYNIGDFTGAIDNTNTAIAKDSANYNAFFLRGLLRAKAAKDKPYLNYFTEGAKNQIINYKLYYYKAAKNDFAYATKLNPFDYAAYYNKAYLNSLLGADKLALSNYKRAIELNNYFEEAYVNKAATYYNFSKQTGYFENNFSDISLTSIEKSKFKLNSLSLLDSVLNINEHNSKALYNKAFILKNIALYDKSVLYYTDFLRITKDFIPDKNIVLSELCVTYDFINNKNFEKNLMPERNYAYEEFFENNLILKKYIDSPETILPGYIDMPVFTHYDTDYTHPTHTEEVSADDISVRKPEEPKYDITKPDEVADVKDDVEPDIDDIQRQLLEYSEKDFAHTRDIDDIGLGDYDICDLALFYNMRGNQKYRRGDYKGAILDYTQAIVLEPQIPIFYNNRGSAKAQLREYFSSLEDFNKAVELNSKYVNAYYNRGNLKYRFRRFRQAIEDYDIAIELAPENPDIYYNRACANFELNNRFEAFADWEKAEKYGWGEDSKSDINNNGMFIFD